MQVLQYLVEENAFGHIIHHHTINISIIPRNEDGIQLKPSHKHTVFVRWLVPHSPKNYPSLRFRT